MKSQTVGNPTFGMRQRFSDTSTACRSGSIYLSGPVTGLSLPALRTWREEFQLLVGARAAFFDPTSGPIVTQRLAGLGGENTSKGFSELARDIVARNRNAIANCNLVIANFLNATDTSIGAVGEIFWADAFRKPILIVREEQSNRHDHLMVNELATWIVYDLAQAATLTKSFLGISDGTAS